MNFCPTAISDDIDNNFLLDLVKHEILHALVSTSYTPAQDCNKVYFLQGFSVALYPFWRNETGQPRSTRDQYGRPLIDNGQFVISDTTIQEVTYNDWMTQNGAVSHTVTLMVTPRVVVSCLVVKMVK